MALRIVLDTNVLIAALKSRKGASFRLIELVGTDRFTISVSVPLILEYEYAAGKLAESIGLTERDIENILDYLYRIAEHRRIFFLWRPFLKDPNDDMVLELAVESESDYIVTHNIRDFEGVGQFGLKAISPREFLKVIGEIS